MIFFWGSPKRKRKGSGDLYHQTQLITFFKEVEKDPSLLLPEHLLNAAVAGFGVMYWKNSNREHAGGRLSYRRSWAWLEMDLGELLLPFHMAWLKMQMLLACSGLEACEAALVEGSCVSAVAVS